mmetsp:Transcript_45452/g.117571  ORF Transcript_45452/g.117571 Transcript_45452/m.117571 type:complete len:92 (-) Transcript_45452:62-337(-)
MSSVLACYDGYSPLAVKVDGADETVYMDPENGPLKVEIDGSVRPINWEYGMISMHWTRFQKPWSDMSSTEKEVLVYQVAKMNKKLRERMQG